MRTLVQLISLALCLCQRADHPLSPKPRLQQSPPPASLVSAMPAELAAQRDSFRVGLTAADLLQVTIARRLLQLASVLPLGLYALFEPRPRLFPMSISWTIRRGLPRLVSGACLLGGWVTFLQVVLRVQGLASRPGSSFRRWQPALSLFSAQWTRIASFSAPFTGFQPQHTLFL